MQVFNVTPSQVWLVIRVIPQAVDLLYKKKTAQRAKDEVFFIDKRLQR